MSNSAGGSWGCIRCAQIGKTCCQRSQVLITVGDRTRIAEHTGRVEFWEHRPPDDASYVDQDHDPNWMAWGFLPDGTRPILKRRPDGDCLFLTPAGCSLPTDVRPLVCRLYPYSYTQAGIDGVAKGCPREVVRPGTTILQTLDLRLESAVGWHRMLYRELETKERCDEGGDRVRLAG